MLLTPVKNERTLQLLDNYDLLRFYQELFTSSFCPIQQTAVVFDMADRQT